MSITAGEVSELVQDEGPFRPVEMLAKFYNMRYDDDDDEVFYKTGKILSKISCLSHFQSILINKQKKKN